MSILANITTLTRQLYPTGRAFKMPAGSILEKLHAGLAVSEATAYAAALSLPDAALPDTDRFTAADAAVWERRLGLITNERVALADRKAALIRKMNHPGTIPARQSPRYLEKALRTAGFGVYIHENKFDDGHGGIEARNPLTIAPSDADILQHADAQHADAQHGGGFTSIVANSTDNAVDTAFNVGQNLRFTFFVGGRRLGEKAEVDADREPEFRQLILKIKPAHTVAYLFINYI